MTTALSIKDLSKTYDTGLTALNSVDLDIKRGEILALLGPNGAGKTTMISIICGLVKPTTGTVTVEGNDIVQNYRQARQLIGLVPQELHTETFETGWATVSYSRGLFGKKPAPALVEQILRDLSLYRVSKDYLENLMFTKSTENSNIVNNNPEAINMGIAELVLKQWALDTIFTLHADHEQNASTTVVRGVASTGAHPYVAISSGISALWGRAHGGANESVIAQLEYIGSVDKVEAFIERAKDPDDDFRLMGFGHRVYKNFDPRAKILKGLQDELREELDLNTELMAIARKIEEIALNDDYFISRNLYPNIDFYTGIILTALQIPKSMFTPVFVIGRTVGWITQWIEFKKDETSKIARPRQLYTGK